MPIFNIRSNGPRYVGYIWPPYPIDLKRDGNVIPLTGVDPSVIQVVLRPVSGGSDKVGAGTCEIPTDTAAQGKIFYNFAIADLETPGRYYICVSLQLPSDPAPMACDMVAMEIKPYPAYAGGTTPSLVPQPMLIISRGKPIYTNDDFDGNFPATLGNNGLYGNYWRGKTTPVANADSGTLTQEIYLALDLSSVPSAQRAQVLAVWYNDPMTGIYDPSIVSQTYNNTPRDYFLELNAAPNGTLPTTGWTTATTVTNNQYHSRQHVVDMTNSNWIRIRVTAINGSALNNNCALNLDVHDIHLGNQDNWIFAGDSICQRGMDHSDTILPELINTAAPTHWPVMECAGIGGDLSTSRVNVFADWLAQFSGHYVGLLYGTNDAGNAGPGDPNFGPAFSTAMANLIDMIIAAGKIPVLPRSIPWGKTTNIQANGPTINSRLTSLFNTYPQAIPGPDLWAYFQAHPELINDNDVHPTVDGYTAYRQQWADALLANVYQTP